MGRLCKPNIYVSWSTSELRVRFNPVETGLSHPVKVFLLTVPMRCFFCGSFLLLMFHVGVCCAILSVPCSLVVTCWERADLLADVLLCFAIFPNMSCSTLELRPKLAPWNWFKPSSKIFLLTAPRRYFFCWSFMLFLSCVCYDFVWVCLLMPCCHLLGKGWPLGSRLWCLTVSLLLSRWYPGSGWYLIVSIPDLSPLSYFAIILLRKGGLFALL